ncbi:MAG: MarR family EPS-associated transcriptional regulator [Campylobacterota bacterium]|nr:MarR family EPS-associated transcriptional regulator [Campylobacterota bacterium]
MTHINTDQIDLLHVMQKVEDITSQKELAEKVGFSVGKVNYVIKALLEKGYIKVENFVKSSNKRAYKYILTSDGLRNKITLTEKYIAIKKREYESLEENLELDKQRENAK